MSMLKSIALFVSSGIVFFFTSPRATEAAPPLTYGSTVTVQGVIGTTAGHVLTLTLDHPLSVVHNGAQAREEPVLEVVGLSMQGDVSSKHAQITGTLAYIPMPGNDGHDVAINVRQVQWL